MSKEPNPPVQTAEELAEQGHSNPEVGAFFSNIGFETRPGHTWPTDDCKLCQEEAA